ncbi:MAG: hypothetical protein IJS69_04555, partial [Selenomonadaceae bacterium]|nr:hypothetical protein [Selenomonadaceae bacterium]
MYIFASMKKFLAIITQLARKNKVAPTKFEGNWVFQFLIAVEGIVARRAEYARKYFGRRLTLLTY